MANITQERSENSLYLIRNFRELLESCFGPQGKIKMLISEGGYLTTTSNSRKLLQNIPFTIHPITRLLINCIESQQKVIGDNGLYVGIISSYLIEKAWTENYKKTNNNALKYVCDICLNLVQEMSINVNFDNVTHLINVTKTILSSKSSCNISKKDIELLSIQILKGFIASVGPNSEKQGLGQIIIHTHAGLPTDYSKIIDGILYPFPEEDKNIIKLCHDNKNFKVLLFTCMLNTSSTELKENDVAVTNELKHCNQSVLYFKNMLPIFKKAGINMIACQKVIHDEIHLLYKREGIIVIHRLGKKIANAFEYLTGAIPLDTLCNSKELIKCIGQLDEISHIEINNQSYLKLTKNGRDVHTLLLYHLLPPCLDELEILFKQAIESLSILLNQPKIIPGAGCLETTIARKLNDKLSNYSGNFNKTEITIVLKWITQALLRIPKLIVGTQNTSNLLQDSIYYHAWLEDSDVCLCKSLNKKNLSEDVKWFEILNNYSNNDSSIVLNSNTSNNSIIDVCKAKYSALQHAFDVTNTILSIDYLLFT